MNKDRNINKKTLKKFLDILDKDIDIKSYISEFPDNQEILWQYVKIIESFKRLKNVYANCNFKEKSLKDIYLRARIENIEDQKKDFRKDRFFIRFRPAYFKPLIIFLGIIIFITFSSAGAIYASTYSVPGELLYPVKRTSENIRVILTPYRYENIIYLKMLNSRLNEADVLLNRDDFIDTVVLEKLVKDIDDTYDSCRNRNYFGADQNMQMQIKINAVKEGFKKRYGMQKKNTNGFSGSTINDIQDTTNFNTGAQDFKQDNSGSKDSEAGNNHSTNVYEQNKKSKQNQYGK